MQINAEHSQRQNGIGSKDECYRSSEKRKNYMDWRDQGTWMEEVSLGYYAVLLRYSEKNRDVFMSPDGREVITY